MDDTIAAISTALGVGAISIIRVSGPQSIEIVNKIFKEKNLLNCESHTINYGHIVDNDEFIDEVLIMLMKAPKTFTRENIIEINCHGGIATINKILELLLNNGCRLAEPGEFTKRAFLNGRIGLIEAESVMDIINSETELTRKLAINGIEGKISKLIKNLRQEIIEILANIEVNIDYPEYEDAIEMTNKILNEKLIYIKDEINKILIKSQNTKILKEGIKIGIFGRPNVGKSSILNRLLEEDKAIVTNIEGTTRDIVDGTFILNGVTIKLIDTAGIRTTNDIVEKIGVEKSKKTLEEVDLIIVVLNNNEELTNDDKEILEITKNKNRIILVNKNDLPNKLDLSIFKNEDVITSNTTTIEGLDNLKNRIIEIFNLGKIDDKDLTYLSSARSISLLKKCVDIINEIDVSIMNDIPVDMIQIDLKNIWDILGEIIGESYDDELIDQLFTQFCIGK